MRYRLFIDDDWLEPVNGAYFPTIDPATEEPIAEIARGGAADVDRAVRAADAAMKGPWSRLAPAERGALLFKLADAIAGQREELARLETLDVGKPLKDSLGDIDGVVTTLRYNAGAADKMQGETIPLGPDVVDFTLLEPLGVTAHIVPWNFPLGMAMRSLAPALAAGCTAVLKPAEQSPLSALKFAELLPAAGIPKGVVNVVTGFGEEAGEALVRHPLVRGISFTGSVETGRKILAGAAPGIKPAVLELGGKNPMIVFADADLERAVADALAGSFENCGQVCSSSSRYLLEPAIREDFLGLLGERAAKLRVGPGMENPDIGPIVSKDQYERVTGYVARGQAEGARLRLGATVRVISSAAISSSLRSSTAPSPPQRSRGKRSSVPSASPSIPPARSRRWISPTGSATGLPPGSIPRTSPGRSASPARSRPARSGSMAGGWAGSRRRPAA
jgi:acyl-CoA reductase-like NAD-dependent aldehyde dehydrogenase